MDGKNTDYYKALGLGPGATKEQIEAAYKTVAIENHPRKIKEQLKQAQKNFRLASDAYKHLTQSEEQRKADEEKKKATLEQHKQAHGHAHPHEIELYYYDPFYNLNSLFNTGLFTFRDFGLEQEHHAHDLFHSDELDHDEFFQDTFGQKPAEGEKEGEKKEEGKKMDNKPHFTTKSFSTHTSIDEQGRKKEVVHKAFIKNGQVKEQNIEKTWDEKGNVTTKILPGTAQNSLTAPTDASKPAEYNQQKH